MRGNVIALPAAAAADAMRRDGNCFWRLFHDIILARVGFLSRPKQTHIVARMISSLPIAAVSVKNLSKTYRPKGSGKSAPKEALKGINLEIPRGSFFGLLGPNGAGKSTLINILAGLVLKTSGTAEVWGYDTSTQTRQAKRAIGVVPQELNLDAFFTPFELMELQAGMYGMPKNQRRTKEILEAVGLADKANAYARTLSGGMRRRLMVAKAMVHHPPVLVLDEPTAGVDVALRQSLWAYVRELNKQGTTILLTTHYLEEAEELCDQIAIINHGQVIANERKDTLIHRLDSKEITVTVEQAMRTTPVTLKPFGFDLITPHQLRLRYQPSQTKLGQNLLAVQAAGLTITDVSTKESDLEDIFIQLTQKAAS